MKNIQKISLFIAVLTVSAFALISIQAKRSGKSSLQFTQSSAEEIFYGLKRGELPISKYLKLLDSSGSNAMAGAGGASGDSTPPPGTDTTCEKKSEVRTKCSSAWTDYSHGALKYFNGTLCRFNNETSAEIETTLCHFRKSMKMDIEYASLPITKTKTFGDKTVVMEVVVPTESWATAAGYQAKGTVTVNDNQYMVIYWGGSDAASSKGFMIEGYREGGLGGRRANYITWNLTNSEAQTLKMYQANFPSGSYLGSAASTTGSYRGDMAIYGAVTFNATTKAVSTQVVLIEEQRSGGTAGQFGCFRMYASGVKDGSVTVAKTQNSMNGTGHATTLSAKTVTEMDAVTLTDSATTANGTGTTLTTQSSIESALGVTSGASVFNVSCNDLYTAGSSGTSSLFSSARTEKVDFSKTVSDVFP